MSDFYVGNRAKSFSEFPEYNEYTRVSLYYDSETLKATVGNDTGREMVLVSPFLPISTSDCEKLAQNILNELSGFNYQPFKATGAELDPSADLGDTLTVGGIESFIGQLDTTFNQAFISDINTPSGDDIEHEYPYVSHEQRQVEREIATTRSMITTTSKEIMMEVSNELNSLSSSIDIKLDSITSTVNGLDGRVTIVEQTASGLTSTVQGLNGQVSTLQQTATSLTSSIQGINGEINSIEQTLQGVAFKSSLADGTTTINGGCITTGQVLASYIKLGGYMDLYESLDSRTIAGRFGKTTVTVNEEPYDALGFTSLGNEYMAADGILFQIASKSIFMVGTTGISLNATGDNAGVAINASGILFNGSIIHYASSDRTLKKNIRYDRCDELSAAFDCLQPVTFDLENEFMEGQHHIGFIAQDVEEAMENAGFKNTLVAKDNHGKYVLNYGEMVALLTAKIKQLEKRLEVLEQ